MTQACLSNQSTSCPWLQIDSGLLEELPEGSGSLSLHLYPRRYRGWSCCSHLAIMWNLQDTHYFLHSVMFSSSVMSDSLWPHEMQHARPPCPSPNPGVHQNPCLLSQWCHPTISASVTPFSFCPQSFPGSGSFQMTQLFAWGGQSIGVSASASVLPMNTHDWSPLGWIGWISLQSKGSQESSPTPQFKSINFSVLSFLHSPTLTSIHYHWKNHSLNYLPRNNMSHLRWLKSFLV